MQRLPSGLYVPRNPVPGFVRNAEVWLDASRITGLADAAAVTTWSDLSGNGNDATQATADNKPLYKVNILAGKPVVRFDGDNDYLQTAAFGAVLSQPSTAIVVGKASAAGQSLIDGMTDVNNRHQFRIQAGDVFRIFAGTGLDDDLVLTLTNFYIFTGVFNGASSASYLNGASATTGDAGAQGLAGLTIGRNFNASGDSLNGDIAEIIVVNQALTAGELNQVHLYLGRKWGIGVS